MIKSISLTRPEYVQNGSMIMCSALYTYTDGSTRSSALLTDGKSLYDNSNKVYEGSIDICTLDVALVSIQAVLWGLQ